MPASVRLRRRPLHKTASSPSRPPRASLDSRIADLVADMSYKEVEDMVAELEKEEERKKVWEKREIVSVYNTITKFYPQQIIVSPFNEKSPVHSVPNRRNTPFITRLE